MYVTANLEKWGVGILVGDKLSKGSQFGAQTKACYVADSWMLDCFVLLAIKLEHSLSF